MIKRSVYWMLLCLNILIVTECYLISTLYQSDLLLIPLIAVLFIFIFMKECDLEPVRLPKQRSKNGS